jgi:preprotein translocase subunit SecF
MAKIIGFVKNIYENHYKALLIIPFAILLLAIIQVGYQTATTGDFMNKGVSLKGGISLDIKKTYDVTELQKFLSAELPKGDISVRSSGEDLYIEASDVDQDELLLKLEEKLGTLIPEDYTLNQIGSSLGKSFFQETFRVIIYAFILMGIVVFVTFRAPTPSLAIILSAASDLIVTLAVINILGIKVGTAGIAAFLMMIGYCVDTNVLLTTRAIKRKEGTLMERIYGSVSTGSMMTLTTLLAVSISLIFSQSEVIKQIMLILLIGLIIDYINTWIQNVSILRLYVERKNKTENVQHHEPSN